MGVGDGLSFGRDFILVREEGTVYSSPAGYLLGARGDESKRLYSGYSPEVQRYRAPGGSGGHEI